LEDPAPVEDLTVADMVAARGKEYGADYKGLSNRALWVPWMLRGNWPRLEWVPFVSRQIAQQLGQLTCAARVKPGQI